MWPSINILRCGSASAPCDRRLPPSTRPAIKREAWSSLQNERTIKHPVASHGVLTALSICFDDNHPLPTSYRLATAAQCAIKMNQIRPLTTKVTATKIIIFCNTSIFFSLISITGLATGIRRHPNCRINYPSSPYVSSMPPRARVGWGNAITGCPSSVFSWLD